MRRLTLSLVALVVAGSGVEGLARLHEGGTEIVGGARGYRTRPGTYGANSRGFHERELAEAKPAGTRRIAVLGDSMTWGTTSAEEAWPRQLEVALGPAVEVLNFSTYGYDARQSWATLPEVWAFHPDQVLLGAYWNDHVPTRGITVGEPPFLVWLAAQRWPWRHSAAWRALDGRAHRDEWNFQPVEGFFREALTGIEEDCRARGVPFLVVVLAPHALAQGVDGCVAFGAPRERCELATGWTQRLVDDATAVGVPLVDARGALSAPSPPSNATDWEHPGPDGHRAIAALVARHL